MILVILMIRVIGVDRGRVPGVAIGSVKVHGVHVAWVVWSLVTVRCSLTRPGWETRDYALGELKMAGITVQQSFSPRIISKLPPRVFRTWRSSFIRPSQNSLRHDAQSSQRVVHNRILIICAGYSKF
jgi:hypothetical protein